MSHPDDRAYLPPEDNEDNQREGRSRHSLTGGSRIKEDKRKRKLPQHRHRRHHHHQHLDEQHQGEGMNAEELIEHFRQLLEDGDEQPGTDIQKARNALEATAGNMEMAAQLYWDDYVASQAVANPPQPPPQQKESKADRKVAAKGRKSPKNDEDSSDDDYDPPSPSLRRSLDGDFGRAAGEDRPQHAANNNDQGGDEHGNHESSRRLRQSRTHRRVAANRQAPMEMGLNFDNGNDADEQIQRGIEQQQQQQQRQVVREAMRGQQARLDLGESVSVSDDETGCAGVWKMVGTMVARRSHLPPNDLGQRVREAAAAAPDKVLCHPDPWDKQRKRRKLLPDPEDDETDYISDSDWLEEDVSQVKDPFELLWGGTSKPVSSGASVSENPEGNVVADEDADEQSVSGVPHTWLVSVGSVSTLVSSFI